MENLKSQLLTHAVSIYKLDYPVNLYVSDQIPDHVFDQALRELRKEVAANFEEALVNLRAVDEVVLGLIPVKKTAVCYDIPER